MRIDPKMVPVQDDSHAGVPRGEIPWAVHALAAEEYNRHHQQTAERLAERGGFSWAELVACFRGDYSPSGCLKAHADLARISEARATKTKGGEE